MKRLHLVKGFFAQNKQSNFMVGPDIKDVVDKRSYKFEDEHDVIPFVEI